MKKIATFTIALFTLSLFQINESRAAFPIKKEAAKSQSTVTAKPAETNLSATSMSVENLSEQAQMIKTESKAKQFLHKKANSSTIPVGLYILLAIFFLGWLAIGINDDWEGYAWLLALLLYIILWLPGFIFSLIKMGDYY